MRRNKVLITLYGLGAVASMAFATITLADSNLAPISINEGTTYLSSSLGYGSNNKNPYTNSNQSLGLLSGVNGGYQINPYFALEGGYTALPNVTLGNSPLTKNNSMTKAAGKGIIHLDQKLDLYGKLGVASISTEYNAVDNTLNTNHATNFESRITPYYGGGLGINISRYSELTLEYDMTSQNGPVQATQALLTSIQLKF